MRSRWDGRREKNAMRQTDRRDLHEAKAHTHKHGISK